MAYPDEPSGFRPRVVPITPRITGVELAEPQPPRRWACNWLGISAGRPTILTGEGGSRKGWLTMALLLHAAADRQLFGHSTLQGMRVTYFDWEQTLAETRERFQLLSRGYGIDLAKLGERINYEWMSVKSLAKEESYDAMCRKTEGIGLASIDSTRSSSVGVRENSEEASIAGNTLMRVSEATGCAFVMLDHTGLPDPNGQRQRQHATRGHSSKRDIASTLLVVSAELKQPTLVTMERCQTKPQEAWAEPFSFTLGTTQDGGKKLVLTPTEGQQSAKDDWAAKKKKVLDFITANDGVAGKYAVSHDKSVKIRDIDVGRLIDELDAEGKVEIRKTRGRGRGVTLHAIKTDSCK